MSVNNFIHWLWKDSKNKFTSDSAANTSILHPSQSTEHRLRIHFHWNWTGVEKLYMKYAFIILQAQEQTLSWRFERTELLWTNLVALYTVLDVFWLRKLIIIVNFVLLCWLAWSKKIWLFLNGKNEHNLTDLFPYMWQS